MPVSVVEDVDELSDDADVVDDTEVVLLVSLELLDVDSALLILLNSVEIN